MVTERKLLVEGLVVLLVVIALPKGLSGITLPRVSHRYICVLSALAHTIVNDPAQLDEVAMKLAPQAMLDQSSLLRGLHRVKDKIDEALANA